MRRSPRLCLICEFSTLLSQFLIFSVFTLLSVPCYSRSYNIQRLGLTELLATKNGYICGCDNYVYVSKGDEFAIVDINTGQYELHNVETILQVDLGHGKACRARSGDPTIHLILPNKTYGSQDDASIYVYDVTDWEYPTLKGLIKSADLNFRVPGGSFYSAFVDASTPSDPGSPVWVFAASNRCKDYENELCNDTVYIFNIASVIDASLAGPLPMKIEKPDTIWYPGINPGFPAGPVHARGHDVTVHGNRLIVTNPGGGLYIVDIDPLYGPQPPPEPLELGRCEYDRAMTHDGWATEDLSYVFTTDEYFKEWGCQRPIGDVTVYDIQSIAPDLCSQQAGGYAPSTAMTSHYCYIKGDLGYVANYNRGLRIIDVSDPTDPVEVGYYDTYLGPDVPTYVWEPIHGVVDIWPYYGDYISACDHDSGIFVLQFTGADPGCLSGIVRSGIDQVPIEGAWVYSSLADRGTAADDNGYYELKTAQDEHLIIASALGFSPAAHADLNISTEECMGDKDLFLQSNSSDLATAWNNGAKVVVDSISCIHVVYQNLTEPHQHGGPNDPSTISHSVTYAYSTDRGVSWELQHFAGAYHPSLAIDRDNVPHIVLLQHVGKVIPPPANEYLLHYWRDLESGEWQSEIIFACEDFGVMFTPSITIAANAMIQSPGVAWEHVEEDVSSIWYWDPSLGSPEEITQGTDVHSVRYPTIASDASTAPHVLWQDTPSHEILHKYREGPGSWHDALTVAYDASHPCVDGPGSVLDSLTVSYWRIRAFALLYSWPSECCFSDRNGA